MQRLSSAAEMRRVQASAPLVSSCMSKHLTLESVVATLYIPPSTILKNSTFYPKSDFFLVSFNVNYFNLCIIYTRVRTLIVATIYLQLIQNRYMFRSFTVLSYDFHIAGNGLYTMLVTTLKDSKTSKHVSILYQL